MGEIPHIFFRFATRLFAMLLGVLSFCLLLPSCPDRASSDRRLTRSAAIAATSVTLPHLNFDWHYSRDLWAESAFTYSDLLWGAGGPSADLTQALQHAHISVQKAVKLAPHQSGAWLFLAALTSHYPSQGFNPTEALRCDITLDQVSGILCRRVCA